MAMQPRTEYKLITDNNKHFKHTFKQTNLGRKIEKRWKGDNEQTLNRENIAN